jgi:hypothetical protein
VVTIYQQMTTVKPMLHAAVDALPANGATAVWDGIYAGIIELINNGVNQCRAVIAMTDGGDNSSTRTVAEIISLANRHRIRVFTIGLGGGINATELEQIALLTGGRYYQTPNAGQLAAIYQEISTIIFQGFQECIITYERDCADGGMRTVELQLRNFCGGTDVKTKTYRAPLDSTTFSNLYMELGDAEGKGGTDIKVPLNLITPIDDEMFYPFTFTLLFDPQCLQFKGVATPPGSLLAGMPINVTPVAGGAQISVTDRRLLNGNGLLMEFTFAASDPADTVCCEVQGIDAKFEQGCFIPIIDPGEVCIFPRIPIVSCDIDAPMELVWQRGIKDYTPNPFPVLMRIYNTGDKEATNVRFKIDYNSADVQLVSPLSDVQTGTPKDLKAGEFSEVLWQVAAKRRTSGDSTEFCITASFDNHEDVTCCIKVYIPPTEPILECTIDAPAIVADNANVRYNPMPFPVTVTVTNTGGMRTDSVFATIYITPDLTLATGEQSTKRVLPSLLFPSQQGQAQWMLRHPPTTVEKQYVIKVWVKTSNADSTLCEKTIIIPPLDSPILAPRCYVPDELFFDEALDAYVPNPFPVRLTCVNNGNTEARNVTGTLTLPMDVELVDPAEPLTKTFTPSTMGKWKIGDPVPELTWQVRWTKRYRVEKLPEFRFTVTGENFAGIKLDSTEVRCDTRVPGLLPLFACDIVMPDSLGLNASETNVEPNPFTVRYTVTNKSKQLGRITRIYISFPPDGLTLSPTSPNPMNQSLNLSLDKDESQTFEWIIDVANRITRRNVLITVTPIDDEGNPVACEDWLPIANLKTALACNLETSEARLNYIPVLQDYTPTTFVIKATLNNSGGANLNDVTAELEWTDDSGQDLIEFDPAFADNTNPKTRGVMFPQQTVEFTWGFRLKNKNTTNIPQYMGFNIKYGSKETPFIERGGCETVVEIMPVVAPELVCTLGGPDTIRFNVDRYEPTPFYVDLHVENIGTGEARNVKAYILQDTRFTLVPPSSRTLGNLAPSESRDLLGVDGYQLKVNPREVSGYDTVRAVLVGEGVMTTCELPIYVEREQKPRFEMVCQTSAVLRFDDVLNDYVPSPFDVETVVRNVGDTKAKNCQLVFVGPPRFMPFDQVTSIAIGDLEVGEERTVTWRMIPLRRDVGGTESLQFQVHGAGGLGDRIVIGSCEVDVYVPPARAAEYNCAVDIQPVTFDPTTGSYFPDPFLVTATMRNDGQADGMGLQGEITVANGLYLSTGQNAIQLIPQTVAPGEDVQLQWMVRPIARPVGDSLLVTVKFTDRFGNATICVQKVWIPEAPEPGLVLTCATELSELVVDPVRGAYVKGTFKVSAQVTNTSGRSVFDVEVAAISMDNLLKIDGVNPQIVAPRLDDGAPAVVATWDATALARTQEAQVQVLFLVSGRDEQGNPVPTRECSVWITIPEVGQPELRCDLTTSVTNNNDDMTIGYDETRGDYEGEASTVGDYTVFTLTAQVRNNGVAQANRVRATILLPENFTLEEGEQAIKQVNPSDIEAQKTGTVSWKIRPIAVGEPKLRTFEVLLTAENGATQRCDMTVTLAEAPRVVNLDLPDDAVGSSGAKVTVPVLIGETLGRDVFAYKLTVRYDPALVRFVDATSVASMTARGWNGVKAVALTELGSAQPNLVRIEDYTTGSPLSTSRTGALVFLRFEVVHNGTDPMAPGYVTQSDLEFVADVVVAEGGRRLLGSMNSVRDEEAGDISLITQNGTVTVSGDCILPLSQAMRLEQNVPNPFNPTTVIRYELGEESDYTLTLFDAMGRKLRTLEQGHKAAGKHEYVLDASDLPSGVYLYRLDAKDFSDTKRMVLSK